MIATTGFFDGVHAGHRLVIKRLVSAAKARGDESLVVTFWPHPRTVLQDGARDLRLLTTLGEKKRMLEELGVDRIEVLGFSREFASLTAAEYLQDVLQRRFGVTTLFVGYDNRLGSDRLTAASLKDLARRFGMEVEELPPLGDISSTKIRRTLEEGRVTDAAAMLGYGYSLEGVVVAGNRLGRTIGFPTANMQLYEPLKLVPAHGVYAVEAEVVGKTLRGMTNIGTRPTVGGTVPTIETHLLDFDEDIYGLPLRITFLRRIRDEIRFPSLEALRRQLEKDREACR
jgi:riboflavin kinase/FMN adenylyltransferase